MMTPIQEKLSAARTNLLMNSPFFGTLGLFLRLVETEQIKTMAVDGERMFYSPEFVDSRTPQDLRTIICHEILHVVYKHHLRKGVREHMLWNIACDYVVNLSLVKAGFQALSDWLYDEKYEGMSAEQVYELLVDQKEKNPDKFQKMFGDLGEESMPGEVLPGIQKGTGGDEPGSGVPMSQAEVTAAELDLNSKVIMAANAARKAGKLPAGVEGLIEEMTESKVDWETVLSRFIDSFAKNDFSYRRLNRSMYQRGLIGPGVMSEELGNALIVMDLSGSIGREEKVEELGEVFGILDRYDVHLTLATADTEFYMVGQWDKGDLPDPDQLSFPGGGGTSLERLNDWVAENGVNPRFCVYLSDGYLSDWGKEPEFPLLVGILPGGTKQYVPEWAEVVDIIK